ncbi:MAG TPA: hypothetical protein VGH43_05960 [Jatrophihabitans sp.]
MNVAAKLAFTTQPSSTATGGTAFGTQPVVTVQDAGGNTVATDTSSVTLGLTTANGATLSCNVNPKAASNGVATFAGCKIDKAGTYTLTATDGSLTTAVSTAIAVSAGSAAKLAFTTQPFSTATGGTAFGTQPVVTVQDAGGNTVTTDTSSVTLGLTTANGATLSCNVNPKAASSGVATFAGCKIDKAGTYTLTATDQSLTSAVSTAIAVSTGSAAKLVFSTPPSSAATGGTAFGTQPVVTVQDAGGNTVATDTSSVTLALTTANGATLTCTANTRAASNGVATFSGCAIDKTGTYTLTATDGSLTSGVSTAIGVSTGSAAKLAFTTQPSSTATGGTAFGTQPVVTVQDAGGNTVVGDSRTVTMVLMDASGNPVSNGAALTCNPSTNQVNASNGVATFASCTIDKAGTYTLKATDGTLTSTLSGAITVSVGSATRFMVSPSTTTPKAGTSFTVSLTAQDAGGNTVPSYTGPKTIAFSGPGAAPNGTAPAYPASVTFSGGAGTASVTLYKAEAVNIAATQGPLTGSASVAVGNAGATNFRLINCAVNGSSASCTPPFSLGNNGTFTASLQSIDAWGNTATVVGDTSVTVSSANPTTYSISSGPTDQIIAGTSQSTTAFTVQKNSTANNSTTITAAAQGFTSLTFTVQK